MTEHLPTGNVLRFSECLLKSAVKNDMESDGLFLNCLLNCADLPTASDVIPEFIEP